MEANIGLEWSKKRYGPHRFLGNPFPGGPLTVFFRPCLTSPTGVCAELPAQQLPAHHWQSA